MKKYYYRFPADSEAGKKLKLFHEACIDAEKAAENFAAQCKAVSYYEDPLSLFGGVVGLVFDDPEKVNTDEWICIGKQQETGEMLFLPNKEKSQLAAAIDEVRLKLPVTKVEDFYMIVHSEQPKTKMPNFSPTFFLHNGQWYISLGLRILDLQFKKIYAPEFKVARDAFNKE